MIKGINRQVVEVTETGSDCFEKILFFVKPEYASLSEGKIRERAALLTRGSTPPPPTKSKSTALNQTVKLVFCALAGVLLGIGVSLLVK